MNKQINTFGKSNLYLKDLNDALLKNIYTSETNLIFLFTNCNLESDVKVQYAEYILKNSLVKSAENIFFFQEYIELNKAPQIAPSKLQTIYDFTRSKIKSFIGLN